LLYPFLACGLLARAPDFNRSEMPSVVARCRVAPGVHRIALAISPTGFFPARDFKVRESSGDQGRRADAFLAGVIVFFFFVSAFFIFRFPF
jgi:hypothetical protein